MGDALAPDDYARAILNILEDSQEEKQKSEHAFRASVNILLDLDDERALASTVHLAMLNILEDSADERAWLEATQRGVLNILDDFDIERIKSERAFRDLAREAGEREQAEHALAEARDLAEAANRELESTNAELEAFSYSVAHDLRTPLRAIAGFSSMLLEDHAAQLGTEGRRLLDVVVDNVARMAELIDSLLAFSRLGRSELSKTPIDMGALVHEVVVELLAQEGDRRIEWTIAPLAPAWGDAPTIRQIWVNLISNALKFTSERDEARIAVECTAGDGVMVYSVSDNGAGFEMRHADKLFGVFQRLHSTNDFPGNGIGLATVSRIAQRHGGRAWAQGAVGEGAQVSFALPAEGEP